MQIALFWIDVQVLVLYSAGGRLLLLVAFINQKAVLCEMTQYSIRSKQSIIRAQAVYFMHSMMPSVMFL